MSTMTFSGTAARSASARPSRVGTSGAGTSRVGTERVGLSNGTIAQPSRPVRSAPGRPGRRSGRTSGPVGRAGSGVPAPQLRRSAAVAAASCVADARPSVPRRQPRSSVSLTDRGIAVILVAGVMIAIAALTVVGATASHVTSDRYLLASVSAR